jgi:hypothetical protein
MSKPYMPDESNIGVYCWLIEIALINMWIPMDLWLRAHNHEYMTTEFREGIASPVWGPILLLLIGNTVLVFVGHMWFKWW